MRVRSSDPNRLASASVVYPGWRNPWTELSMDTLDHEPVADEAGITKVRLGTANFGVWRV